jgi:hypothetical protein
LKFAISHSDSELEEDADEKQHHEPEDDSMSLKYAPLEISAFLDTRT